MANLYYCNFGVRFILCASACNLVFYPSLLKARVNDQQYISINLNEMAFVTRMEKLIEKTKKYT